MQNSSSFLYQIVTHAESLVCTTGLEVQLKIPSGEKVWIEHKFEYFKSIFKCNLMLNVCNHISNVDFMS